MTETVTQYPYSPGLEGVPAGHTAISEIDSQRSSLTYRGYNVHDLAEKGSYEETAFLLLHKKLPTLAELAEFRALLGAEREVPEQVYQALGTLPSDANPMDVIRTGYSVLAAYDPDYRADTSDEKANLRIATRIIAKGTTLLGNGYRISQGLKPLKPNPEHSTAANLLHLITGADPIPKTVETMDVSLILYAEHGFNASTFACRVTVSTLSDLYSGVVAGISTLRGPLHGGANEEAMKMILEIGSADKAEAWIRDALATKKKVMGFGHREYKHGDNRAIHMTKVARQLGIEQGNTAYGEIAETLERVMLEEKGIYPNVDLPTGYAYYLLGIPIPLYTPIFAAARVAGYCAHAIEQLSNNRLIRPKAIYNGPEMMHYVPLSAR